MRNLVYNMGAELVGKMLGHHSRASAVRGGATENWELRTMNR